MSLKIAHANCYIIYYVAWSKITKKQKINEQGAIHEKAFLFFWAISRETYAVFVVFGGILVEAIKEMNDLANFLFFEKLRSFLERRVRCINSVYFQDIVGYLVEAPPR